MFVVVKLEEVTLAASVALGRMPPTQFAVFVQSPSAAVVCQFVA
jgi:hypothetical protein